MKQVEWRKSRFSETEACVEVAYFASRVGIRDSKHPSGEHLTVPVEALRRLTTAVK